MEHETSMPWRPSGETELIAGTPPGGGQDRPARILIGLLNAEGQLSQPMKLTNIPGRGGGNGWDHVAARAGDPNVLVISSPTVISNRLLGVSDLEFTDLTPLANLYTEYPVFIVRLDSPLATMADLSKRLASDTSAVQVAIATAIGNPNHIALAKVTTHAGGDVKALKINVFDSARYAIAQVLEGGANLGIITAASPVPELTAGTLRTLAVSAPSRLGGLFAQAPTLLELGIDCDIGMWRGVFAAKGIGADQLSFWERSLQQAVASAEWKAELNKHYWNDTFATGPAVLAHLQREQTLTREALGDLGLLPGKALGSGDAG
jgi:putative tricarboxylic transport membrane protein